MNKLIIIGNGFDIAHGYATGYQDFFRWLVTKELVKAYETQYSNGGKLENAVFSYSYDRGFFHPPGNVKEYLYATYDAIIKSAIKNSQGYWGGARPARNAPFDLRGKGHFINHIFEGACENWVDIEQAYYIQLRKILKNVDNSGKVNETNLQKLNEQLQFLRDQLKEYLSGLPKDHCISELQPILNKEIDIDMLFLPKEWDDGSGNIEIPPPTDRKTYVLNFNYTDTISQYFKPEESVTVSNIHGSLTDEQNPLIFGYGDELDDDFQMMEKQETQGFLENIKSLWYLRTNSYHNLIRFVETAPYQVQIFGHSCGRSDRTLLNMVFEHDNCNSVDIHYRRKSDGTDNFNGISEEISRQFTDKKKLRKRVLAKNPNNIIPQYKR